MDKHILPKAYVEKFSLSQFSVPPLSPALVNKTFKRYLGKLPQELFDKFNPEAINAASIGQVHQAWKEGKKLAVKIQYPGVAESIGSDLALVKPIAMNMFKLKGKDADRYFNEVKSKLMEETDYELELEQSQRLVNKCQHLPNLRFPNYYPELSSSRVITMDWMDGKHLSEYTRVQTDQLTSNRIGQTLWDFYIFQMHDLKEFHADPHPGNFLIDDQGQLIVLDFGCLKSIPESFYRPYFNLIQPHVLGHETEFRKHLEMLEIIRPDDSEDEAATVMSTFRELLTLFTQPFRQEKFDFSDQNYFDRIVAMGEAFARDPELKKLNANRGSEHFIYMNRTFFGLYHLLFDLKANEIFTKTFMSEQ